MSSRARVIVVLAVLAVAMVSVARANRAEEVPIRIALSLFPMQLGEWQGVQRPPFTDRVLEVLGLDDYLTRYYYDRNREIVDVYIWYWQSQQQGGAIHSPQNCLPGSGWEPVSQGILTFPDPRTPGAPALSVNRYMIRKGADRQLVLYWYQSRGRIVGSEYWSKIYLVLDAARYNRTDAALVRLVVPVANGSPEAEARAESQAIAFANTMLPALSAFLPN
jgi:EpsI family protein